MAELSAIEWTDATWNPVTGCDRVSPGCAHCYALTLAQRLKAMGQPRYQRDGDPKTSGPGFGVTLHPDLLELPLRWRRPRMVFVNSMSDLFHEEIPYEFVREVFNVMRRCDGGIIAATGKSDPSHIFQVLTKRPEVALELWRTRRLGFDAWPPHIWLGVSIENTRYTYRADVLREIPAAVRFISAEPLLGSLYQTATIRPPLDEVDDVALEGSPAARGRAPLDLTEIDWLIVGGESGGRDARPMHPQWTRELRDAALASCPACHGEGFIERSYIEWGSDKPCDCVGRTAFFFKQWGSWSPADHGIDGVPVDDRGQLRNRNELDSFRLPPTWAPMRYRGASPKSGGRLLDGREWNEMPSTERRRDGQTALA